MNDQTKNDVDRLRMDAVHDDAISGEEDIAENPLAIALYKARASLLRRAADAMEELSKLQSAGGDVTQEDIDSLLTEAATYDINAMEPGITEKEKAFCVAEAAKCRRIVNAVVERGKLKAENLEWLAAVRESYHAGTWEAHAKAQQKLSDLRLGNADVNTPETVLEALRKERDRLEAAAGFREWAAFRRRVADKLEELVRLKG